MIINNIAQAAQVLKDNDIKLYTFDSSVMFDTYLSQSYFDDFKSELENQSIWCGDNSTDYLVIFADEKLMNAPHYKTSNLRKMTKQALYDLCENYEILDYFYSDSNFKDTTKQALISELMKYCTNEKHYTWHYNVARYRDLECTFSINGYSQGDSCRVLLVGKCEPYLNSDYLTNIFYDSPLVGEITVSLNGEEIEEIKLYEIDDFNEYDYYDKTKLIELISKHTVNDEYHDILQEYLNASLPTNAPYSN